MKSRAGNVVKGRYMGPVWKLQSFAMPLSLWLSPKLFCNSCSHPVHLISAIIWTSFQFYCVFSLAFYCFFLFAFECLWMSVSVSGCLLMSVLFSDVVCTVERRYVHWQSNVQTPGLHRESRGAYYLYFISQPPTPPDLLCLYLYFLSIYTMLKVLQ